MEKIQYLRKFSRSIEIRQINSLSLSEQRTIPSYWTDALSKDNLDERNAVILSEWEKFNYQFQSTISYLHKNLKSVELASIDGKFALIYEILNLAGKSVYYIGNNTLKGGFPDLLGERKTKLPPSLLEVYNDLHNGWVYFPSRSNGLSPAESLIVLGEMDWGILEDINVQELPFDLDQCIGVFSNGSGGYVAFNLDSLDNKRGFIWWHDKKPTLDMEIWPLIDEWTKMGIER